MSNDRPKMSNRIITLLLFLQFAVTIEAGAHERRKPSTRIVGGQEAIPHSHPYIISLQLKVLYIKKHFCGGTLISDKWILTAAHCLTDWLKRWLSMYAIAGAHRVYDRDHSVQEKIIDKRILHPQYDSTILHNDVALVSTTTSFHLNEFVKPAKLPFGHGIKYSPLTVAGWGVIGHANIIQNWLFNLTLELQADTLQESKPTYWPHELCEEYAHKLEGREMIRKEMHICTKAHTSAVCFGDSGGPLISYMRMGELQETDKFNYDDNKKKHKCAKRSKPDELVAVVVGIASYMLDTRFTQCNNVPAVFAKVQNYLTFISSYIDQ